MTTYIADRKKMLKRLTGFRTLQGDKIDRIDPALVTRLNDTINVLSTPVKITIAGLSDSQHHALTNLFAGTTLVAEGTATCPPLHLHHGTEARTSTTIGDQKRAFRGCVVEKLISLGAKEPIRVDVPTMLLPYAELSVLPAYETHDDQSGYLLDLIGESDVVIWCSNATTPWQPRERRLWFTVPDDIKERSILALTAAEHVAHDDEAREAYEAKCEFTAEEFAYHIPLAVGAMIDAAPKGAIRDQDRFKAVGGTLFLDTLVELTDGTLLEDAQALRVELDAIPIGTVQTPPSLDVEAAASTVEPESSEADPADTMRAKIISNARACIDTLKTGGDTDTAPLFDAMSTLLADMTASLRGDVQMARDHEALLGQLNEAGDLVSLLGYEGTASAAQEAVDLLRQITMDVIDRLPSVALSGENTPDQPELRKAS